MYTCSTFWLVSDLHPARVKFSPPNASAELFLAPRPLSTKRRMVYLHEVATAYCGDSGGRHSLLVGKKVPNKTFNQRNARSRKGL